MAKTKTNGSVAGLKQAVQHGPKRSTEGSRETAEHIYSGPAYEPDVFTHRGSWCTFKHHTPIIW